MRVVTFGHGKEDQAQYMRARHAISSLYPDVVLTRLTRGWPRSCARACLILKTPYIACIDTAKLEEKGVHRGTPEWTQYMDLVTGAREIVCVVSDEELLAMGDYLLVYWGGRSQELKRLIDLGKAQGKRMTNGHRVWPGGL